MANAFDAASTGWQGNTLFSTTGRHFFRFGCFRRLVTAAPPVGTIFVAQAMSVVLFHLRSERRLPLTDNEVKV